MKRLFLLIFLLMTLALPALGEELPREVSALLKSAHPEHALTQVVSGGSPAIAVMSRGDSHVLCIAEKKDSAWALTVDNPTALHRGVQPSFLWEGGNSLYWRYTDMQRDGFTYIDEYHASLTPDGWSDVDLISYETGSNFERTVAWQEGSIYMHLADYDQEGNPMGAEKLSPPYLLPGLKDKVSLAAFDISLFPTGPSALNLQQLLDALAPGYTVVDGVAGDAIALLADKADGTRRFIGLAWDGQVWNVTESTPLPGNQYCDSFHSSGDKLLIGSNEDYVTVSLQGDQRWRVSFIGREDWFSIGENWIDLEGQRRYGTLPFSTNVTSMTWDALPSSWAEATALLDQSDWAVVNNPDPADRLHLRRAASRSAASLGKYYNGTPVQVLAREGDWAQVRVFGVVGWMMDKYLAYGDAGNAVTPAMPQMFVKDEYTRGVPLYPDTDGRFPITQADGNVWILGLIGDDWYHVLLPWDGVSGYVQQYTVWPGNG